MFPIDKKTTKKVTVVIEDDKPKIYAVEQIIDNDASFKRQDNLAA